MPEINFLNLVNSFCNYFSVSITQQDVVDIVNTLIMLNFFLNNYKGNDAQLRSTQVSSYIIYNELIKKGYEIKAESFGLTDWEGYLET